MELVDVATFDVPVEGLTVSTVTDLHRALHSFPTRRSSDLPRVHMEQRRRERDGHAWSADRGGQNKANREPRRHERDRKSTRLNSSHPSISYAVFCLKKEKCWRHRMPRASRPTSRRSAGL